jgi:hypothetical protein
MILVMILISLIIIPPNNKNKTKVIINEYEAIAKIILGI